MLVIPHLISWYAKVPLYFPLTPSFSLRGLGVGCLGLSFPSIPFLNVLICPPEYGFPIWFGPAYPPPFPNA